MNRIMWLSVAAIVLAAAVVLAQAGRGQAANIVRHRAPSDQALDFPVATLQAEFAEMIAQNWVATRLMEGGTYAGISYINVHYGND